MKLNDIKFLPKANAFSDVYAKATGLPIVGEMMVAAAAQGGEPTPPTPPTPTQTVWYVAFGENFQETSRGTGRQTGVVEDGMQELEILTNDNYPQLVGQMAWVSEIADVDDGQMWPMQMPKGTETGLYLGFYSEEPTPPTQNKVANPTYTYEQDIVYCEEYDLSLYGDLTVNLATTTPNATIYYVSVQGDANSTAENMVWGNIWQTGDTCVFHNDDNKNGTALMKVYASASGMENSDYVYITIPFNTTAAKSCDDVPTVYDLKFQYDDQENINPTAKARVDYTGCTIEVKDVDELFVDIQLVPDANDYTTLVPNPNYNNQIDGSGLNGEVYCKIVISEATDELVNTNITGYLTPYVSVGYINVDVIESESYQISSDINITPQTVSSVTARFEGCPDAVYFEESNGWITSYSGEANFVDGGACTLADDYGSIIWTGTYTYTPLP